MSNRSGFGWLIAIVLLGVLVGIVAGGLMGGLAGFYAAENRAPVAAPQLPTSLPSPTPSATLTITNLRVSQNSAIIDAVKKVEPTVVTLITTIENSPLPFGQARPQASGSGVIIDSDGRIITNNHVIERASKILVIFQDGSSSEATVVGSDPVTDLAVIRATVALPAPATVGDSDALQLGETVIAIGSPLGSYRGSVTLGVVSGLNRSIGGTMQEGLIQSDAAINHGNDGGPLVNLYGQVVGINTLVVRDTRSGAVAEGLGFAVPSNTVRSISQLLIAKGRVDYPFVGINYQVITPQLASENNLSSRDGLVILQVSPGSPAAAAGIRQGDILLAVDSIKIDQVHTYRSILFAHHTGDQVTLTILRDGRSMTTTITLAPAPPSE